jgi:hypothetical protein
MSMRLPPSPDYKNPKQGTRRTFIKISSFLNPSTSFLRANPITCVCYTCAEIYINDTIINTLLCPNCPATMPMMNFSDFNDALQEEARLHNRKKLSSDSGS